MKNRIKLGKIAICRRVYKDSSMGELDFYVPIKELDEGNFLCFSFVAGGNVRTISIDVISEDKATSQIIDATADLKLFGLIDLNKDFSDYIVETSEKYLNTGIRDEIVKALVMCGIIKKFKPDEMTINVTDLIEKSACVYGLRRWNEKYGKKDVMLQTAIKEMSTNGDDKWLEKDFKQESITEAYNREDLRTFLYNLVRVK
jgi:hypothetical protein